MMNMATNEQDFGRRKESRYAAIVLLGSLMGLIAAVPAGASAVAGPTASSALVFGSLPNTVAPGGPVAWAAAAFCTGTTPSTESCAGAGSLYGSVPDGYSVKLVMQPGITCDFSTQTTIGSVDTELGVAGGVFHAPTTPGTYCLQLQHPSQVGLGSGRQKVVDWLPAASDKEVIVVYGSVPNAS